MVADGRAFDVAVATAAPGMSLALNRPGMVLIVDDNADGAESLRLILSLSGYEVRVAYTGTAGIGLARDWRPDVVVCDVGLPDIDGFAVAQALRQDPATAHINLIALTAYSHETARKRARACGFDAFLVKPADPQDLLQLLADPTIKEDER
jgi:CheY-like chemotaxis protein